MDSLQVIASAAVGLNSILYPVECITESVETGEKIRSWLAGNSGLPRSALEIVLPFMSAAELHKISVDLRNMGMELNWLWKQHVISRYNKRMQIGYDFFATLNEDKNCHQLYLSKHFLDLLYFCAAENHKTDPVVVYNLPLPKVGKYLASRCASAEFIVKTKLHVDELLKFSEYGEVVYGSIIQYRYILSNKELLENLLNVTKNIQVMQMVGATYGILRSLLQVFVSYGKVTEVVFSTFKLTDENFLDLLQICSGITSGEQNMNYDDMPTGFCESNRSSGGMKCLVNASETEAVCSKCDRRNDEIQTYAATSSNFLDNSAANNGKYLGQNNENDIDKSLKKVYGFQKNVNIQLSEKSEESSFQKHSDKSPLSDNEMEDASKVPSVKEVLAGESGSKNTMCMQYVPDSGDEDLYLESNSSDMDVQSVDHDLFNEAVRPLTQKQKAHFTRTGAATSVDISEGCCSSSPQNTVHAVDPLHFLREVVIDRLKTEQDRSGESSDSNKPRKSVHSLTILSSSVGGYAAGINLEDLSYALWEVISDWPSLRKIGFFDIDSSSDSFISMVLHLLKKGQLTHLVLDDVLLPDSFFSKLLRIFQLHYSRGCDIENKPLELLDLQGNMSNFSVPEELEMMDPQTGVIHLNLSGNTFAESAVTALSNFIKCDTALVVLNLNSCHLNEHQVKIILQALRERNQIQCLGLSASMVTGEDVEAELLNFFKFVISLKSISMNNCKLRCEFVLKEDFIEVLNGHPNLKELQIENNHLGSAAVNLLKRICCAEKSSISSLNIGYNWIIGGDLLEVSSYIKSKITRPVLEHLSISGNRFSHKIQNNLRKAFEGIVIKLDVDTLDFEHSLAEFVAMM